MNAGPMHAAAMSQREAEVLEAVGGHLSNAQIASRLHISVRTVESHVSSLLRKFGVADRRALADLAPAVAARPPTSTVWPMPLNGESPTNPALTAPNVERATAVTTHDHGSASRTLVNRK